jgi:fructose-1-phosphate kinase PfkB-like protein
LMSYWLRESPAASLQMVRERVYAATNEKRWKITPPRINTVNSTGSGDSMIAGMLYGTRMPGIRKMC